MAASADASPRKRIDKRVRLRFFSGVHPRIIIPARHDAGRLPGKVLLPVANKPLVQHVYERGKASGLGCEPLIATDDERVAGVARDFGAEVVMTSSGHRCGSERVAEVARGLDAELIINLQGDEALIDPNLIGRLPGLFDDPAVDMATIVAPLLDRSQLDEPSVVKAVLDARSDVMYFSRSPIPNPERSSGLSGPFYGHLGVYAFRRDFLIDIYSRPPSALETAEGLEQLRVLEAGHRIRALVGRAVLFGVNTPADLEQVRAILGAALESRREGGP